MGHFARECRGPRNQDSKNMYQDSSRRTVNVKETPPKAMVAIDGVGFDWSFMAYNEVPTNMALMAFSDTKGDPQAALRDTGIFNVDSHGNRVLVTKPHNKTPYKLLIGRAPIISFMRPFGCRVTILNTLDRIGKFNIKADEGFLVGYSINRKAFRVYNSRTKKVEENLHINFLENKPNVAGSGSKIHSDAGQEGKEKVSDQEYILLPVLNTSSKIHSDARQEGKEKVSDQEYILLPVLNTSSYVPLSNEEVVSSPKDNAGNKSTVVPTCVEGGKIDDRGCLDQQMKSTDDSENTNINVVSSSFSHPSALDDFYKMPNLEDTGIFDDTYDDRDEGAEADYNNLEKVIPVSPIPSTRIQKDHPKEQIIGELDEAMQEELLQFKLLNIWTLMDLPHGKRAIRTKWVYRTKRDQRVIIVRNKSKLVAKGHRQEEGIDYDEVFAPVVRIEAIRLFLAYTSFMDFTMYQIDVKSAFLYGTIEEEVYVSQPLGFMDPEFQDRVYKVEKALYDLHQAPRA
nr:putative ribonuclease H-like domain-containing protein [Tanacetum cinerariifolium]